MAPDDFGNPWMANLTEIGSPEPIPWWPPAPGWYVLAGVLASGLLWIVWRLVRRWRANAYRREALARLDVVEKRALAAESHRTALTELPVLLKQTALAAYPRAPVASLTGVEWLGFLDGTLGDTGFTRGPGRSLISLAYAPSAPLDFGDEETVALLALSRRWIQRHRRVLPAAGKTPPC